MNAMEEVSFTTRLDCRYLLHVPVVVPSNPLVMTALHGYSSSPEAMLDLTLKMVGDGHVVAAIQAPNQHYVSNGLPEAGSGSGYNWGISRHWASAVRLHHEILIQVLGALRERFQASP